MLQSLRIKNFRTCADVNITDVGEMLLLVGRNGAGKTSILEAVEWCAKVAVTNGIPDMNAHYDNSSVSLTFNVHSKTFRYTATAHPVTANSRLQDIQSSDLLEHRSGDGPWTIVFERVGTHLTYTNDNGEKDSYSLPDRASSINFLISTVLRLNSPNKNVAAAWHYLTNLKYYSFENLNTSSAFIKPEDYSAWQLDSTGHSSGESTLYKLIDMYENDKESFKEVSDILSSEKLGIIERILVRRSTEQVNIPKTPADFASRESYALFFHCDPQRNGINYYEELSFGTKRILNIVVSLIYDKCSTLLIEQPEDGIHPGLLVKLMSLLDGYADPTQIIIASHSPTVINHINAKDIRIVARKDGHTVCLALTEDEVSAAEDYVNETGQLSDFVRILEQ
ncbi:AAA family ATPase [Burkholderia cenocepacia]|uniref:AAA family ATPase n=1 Tax=Burkholderia cenocepacia TaxID=95486 RepID=UPI001AA0F579|nr:ATP-binding protein [Burkholderia cenocepacia]MBO1853952.1 AAA family ATPase [Burkholderia cenocepacia]MDR5647140.1 ATP-binding protein [Burkholderia cenocepacia]